MKPVKLIAATLILALCTLFFTPAVTVLGVDVKDAELFQNVTSIETYTISSGYDSMTYTKILSQYNKKPLASYVVEVKPSDTFYFEIGHGQYIYGQKRVEKIVAYAKNEGKQVLAAVNGNFFDFGTGLPLGVLMQDGEVVSDDDNHPAFYVAADNSAGTIYPKINCTVTWNDNTYRINDINKRPDSGTAALLTDVYSTSTHSENNCLEIVFEPDSRLYVNQNISAKVLSISDSTHNTAIKEGQFVLSVSKTNSLYNALRNLEIDDTVTFRAAAPEVLTGAKCVIGGWHMLISDGEINPSLSAGNLNPRTAVGVKADGTVVVYSCDGRQPEYSGGLNLVSLATFFYEQGCVAAVNLDGGGSTTFYATTSVISIGVRVNKPAYTSERSVSDALLLFSDRRIVVKKDGGEDPFTVLSAINRQSKSKLDSVSPYLSDSLSQDAAKKKIADNFFGR